MAPKSVINNKSHQKVPKTNQVQEDPKGHLSQVKWAPKNSPTEAATPARLTEILLIHINDVQMSTYNASIGKANIKTLFDSGATFSCISKHCYDQIQHTKPDHITDANVGPPIVITSALNEEVTNLGWCWLRFKLGTKMFKYFLQIIKNLK